MTKCYIEHCEIGVDKESDLFPFCSKEHHQEWASKNYKRPEDKFDRVLRRIQELKKQPSIQVPLPQETLPIPLVYPKVTFKDE